MYQPPSQDIPRLEVHFAITGSIIRLLSQMSDFKPGNSSRSVSTCKSLVVMVAVQGQPRSQDLLEMQVSFVGSIAMVRRL